MPRFALEESSFVVSQSERMYTNLNLFFRAEYLAFCKTKFSLRRWAYVIIFTVIYWVMWMVVALGRFLDRLLFRSFLGQEMWEPVFIIAPPRSGTTLIQRLMALDEERFVHAKLLPDYLPLCFLPALLQCPSPHRPLHWAAADTAGAVVRKKDSSAAGTTCTNFASISRILQLRQRGSLPPLSPRR